MAVDMDSYPCHLSTNILFYKKIINMTKMKILHVIPFLTPSRGGSVVVPYQLSKQLVNRGHDVTLITTDFELNKGYIKSLEDEGIEVIPFRCLFNLGLFLYSPGMKIWLRDNIKKFDVIHMHNFRSYQNILVYSCAITYKIPYILQAHGSLPRIIEKRTLKMLYDLVWGNNILKHANKLIAVSGAEVDQYKKMRIKTDKIAVIPNGIDEAIFENPPLHGEFKKRYRIKEEHMILFLGRIHKRKGIEFLINSFNDLTKEINNVKLVLVGPDDGYKTYLERLVRSLHLEDKVLFVNFVDDVKEAYQDADVLVYPGIYEIFGLVPFEAIICGTTIIVSDDCGCGELVKRNNLGYLVKYGDVNDLKERIKSVIINPDDGERITKMGAKYIIENLRWHIVVKKLETVYEDCAYNS